MNYTVHRHRTPSGYCLRLVRHWTGPTGSTFASLERRRYVYSILDANRIEQKWRFEYEGRVVSDEPQPPRW